MLERVTPNTRCLCAVAAVALIGDYQIERVNWNVEAVSIFFYIRVATKLSERGFSAEQVPGHSLNRRDVNKSMTRFWCGQVFVRQDFRIEWIVITKVFFLETLAIDFIFLGELVPFRRVEGIEFTDGLSGERFAVDEEKNAPNKFRFQQAINLRDREIGFSRSSRHCDHHVVFPARDRLFD